MGFPLILRCTGRLLRELDWRIVQPNWAGSDPRRTWCLNLLWIERRKCLLATHEQTLFSAFAPEVSRADLRELPAFFSAAVTGALVAEGLPIPSSLSTDPTVITKTDARFRRILGSMNELAFMTRYLIGRQGGLARCNLDEIRYRLNHTLLQVKGEGYAEAIDRVARHGIGLPEEV